MPAIYLDYNGTTPVAPEVRDAMLPFLREKFGNPSSSHQIGVPARRAVAEARQRLATLLGAESEEEIVFTSGGTESNNLAIFGHLDATPDRGKRHIVISAFEHPAVEMPARVLESRGFRVSRVAPDSSGVVNPEAVREALADDTALVSIMHANNEIGTIQPIAEVARLCRQRSITVHTDAAQSVGKITTRVDQLNVDLLSVAGHKFYAPKGVGALYVRRGTALRPVIHGAGQERGLRPGTENVAAIVGLGVAAMLADRTLDRAEGQMRQRRDRLAQQLAAGTGGRVSVNGEAAPRLPNTLSINFDGVAGHQLLGRASSVCASTGAACHSGEDSVSSTQAAIGLPVATARTTVRLSLGRFTTDEQLDQAAERLVAAWKQASEQESA